MLPSSLHGSFPLPGRWWYSITRDKSGQKPLTKEGSTAAAELHHGYEPECCKPPVEEIHGNWEQNRCILSVVVLKFSFFQQ